MILFDTPGIIEKKRNKLEERMMMAVVSARPCHASEGGVAGSPAGRAWGSRVSGASAAVHPAATHHVAARPRSLVRPAREGALAHALAGAQVGSIQDSEAIIAVVDAADRPKEALGMFQPGP